MPDITTSDLARFARQSDIELRVTVNQEGQQQIQERHGWLGGRLARGLKIAFGKEDRAQRQQQYLSAKREVLNALKRTYGDEIGERAFRAGVGEMRDGQHRTSSDHPITGRHIQMMIEVAEREVAQLQGVQDFGENGFRDQSGHAMTEQATAGWMSRMAQGQNSPSLDDVDELQNIQQSPSGRFKVGDLHYGLRSEPVPGARGRMTPGLTMTSSIARDLIRDIDRKFRDEPQRAHGFWTIDLELPKPLAGSRQHVIGIFVDRNDPNTIHVFDANRREVAVPRNQFAGWLSAHIKDVYGDISAISLYQAEEKRLGIFERKGDCWTCDEICVLNDDTLNKCRNEAIGRMESGVESGIDDKHSPLLYRNFWKDINRATVTIATLNGEPPLQITRESPELLMPLVEGDMDALKTLSCMLDQSMPNALNDTILTQIKVLDEPCLPEAKHNRSNVDISIMRNGNDLEITYTTEKFLTGFMVYDGGEFLPHGTSHWTDLIKTSTTIKVSIDELHQAGVEGRVPQFEFLTPPNARLQVQNYTGVVNRYVNTDVEKIHDLVVAISKGENLPGRWDQFDLAMVSRVRRQQLIRVTEGGIPIARCLYEKAPSLSLQIGQGEPQRVLEQDAKTVHEMFLGLVEGSEYRVAQLSKLIDTTLVDDFCEELGYAVGASKQEIEDYLEQGYQFSLQAVEIDGVGMVEITMSQNLNTKGLLDPPDDVPNPRVQGSMTIRVPFSELDNGRPENFIVVTKPHFEIRND